MCCWYAGSGCRADSWHFNLLHIPPVRKAPGSLHYLLSAYLQSTPLPYLGVATTKSAGFMFLPAAIQISTKALRS